MLVLQIIGRIKLGIVLLLLLCVYCSLECVLLWISAHISVSQLLVDSMSELHREVQSLNLI